ncbi:MAG TPA: 30S ribosomal protein S2 [Bacteroidia bacterium]|jgi:small subunit ribosomal protein S2|nr:30S ribosomal protein S2 [Bacteroidia bacterium]
MPRTSFDALLEAGAHFGHLKRKWNPNIAPYVFGEKNGIHIIDLNKTLVKLEEAANAMKQIAKSGRTILFVATKKQAKNIVSERIKEVGMPCITERWTGGMLTNFATIRRSVRKMSDMNKMASDGTIEALSKKEKLQLSRQREKMEHQLGSIANMTRLPAAVFVVDITKEHIAISEAHKLNIPTFAIVDTNSDPNKVEFAIPANDDSSTSIRIVIDTLIQAIKEGLDERKDAQVSNKREDGKEEEVETEGVDSKYESADGDEVLAEEEKKAKSHQGGTHHKGGQGHQGGPKRGPVGGNNRRSPVKK